MRTITNIIYPALAVFTVACFLSPQAAAVCQQGCDIPHSNTFLGDDALHSNTTGFENVAIGYQALFSNTTGVDNTATGSFALYSNTIGNENTAYGRVALTNNIGYFNTATGNAALSSNTTGNSNVAVGDVALTDNTTGNSNTATGTFALNQNTTGNENTATGFDALTDNTTGNFNAANGGESLRFNTTGNFNTATGGYALYSNSRGAANVATGLDALFSNTIGSNNTAVGASALVSTTGSNNVGLGMNAGKNLTTGGGNVCIGAGIFGAAGESNTTRIRNIYSSVASNRAVYIDSNNKIGTLVSSRRFKQEIKPMNNSSEAVLKLKPVTFRYKKQIEPNGGIMFGLIAEDVEKVDPDLVTRNEQGEAETVRYEAVNAMLLNEFLKEHRKVEKLEATVERQHKDFEAAVADLKGQIQKVSAQLELSKSGPQTVLNNQ